MKRIDHLLILTIVILTVFGLLMVYNASSVIAFRNFGDKYHFIKDQSVYAALGFVSLIFFSFFDYRKLHKFSLPIFITAIVLLALVFIPGIGIKVLGAHRWVNMGLFIIQPTEFAKLSLAIYMAAWFSKKNKGRLFSFGLLTGLVLLLIMAEPDMGTASIILFEAIVIYFLSGAGIGQFVLMTPIIAIFGIVFIILEPYRLSRLTTFLNLGQSFQGASYQVRQVLIGIGSGGIFGVGLGNSLQKYSYLPEISTDSIFAVIAEELGFIGSTILIIAFMIIIWRGFYIASRSSDTFGKLLAGGITSFLGIQMVINLAAMTALLPLTGVPLPFISYGGSSLVIDLSSIGILLSISRIHTKQMKQIRKK